MHDRDSLSSQVFASFYLVNNFEEESTTKECMTVTPIQELLLIAAINFSAAFIQASTGFGYALVAMSAMPLLLPMSECSAISAVTVLAIGIQMTVALRKNLQIKTILLPILCCLLTINLGLFFLDTFNELLLRVILAGLLLTVVLIFFIMRKKDVVLPKRWYTAAGAGLITGISTGMFNIVGPFFLVYYTNVCKNTLHVKASLEFSFLLAGLYSSGMHLLVYDNITVDVAPKISASVLAALIAGILGLRLYKRIDKDKLVKIVYILLPVMAVMLVINGMN